MDNRWVILAVLTFARTAMGFQFQSIAAVSSQLIDHWQIGYATLGTLIGLYLLPGIFVALPGGALAQRFGDKRLLCIGLLAMAIGGAMTAIDSMLMIVIGRVISGAGGVVLNVLVTKMVTDWFAGREIATAFGFLVVSWPLGIAIALVLLPTISATLGWPAAMVTAAAASTLGLIAVAAVYRGPPASTQNAHFAFDLTRRELVLAALAGWVWTLYNIGFIILPAFGPAFMVASGHDPQTAGTLASIVTWTIIPAVPLAAWIAERIGRIDLAIQTSFLIAGLLIAVVAALGPSLIAFALIGLVLAPPGGLIMTLPGQAVRPERRALGTAIYFTCYYAGMGSLPALAGLLRDLTGHAAMPLWFAVAMIALASLALLQFRAVQRRVIR